SSRSGSSQIARGNATRPIASMPIATLAGGVRLPATPPVKSATPKVAAAPSAAAGERNWFRLTIVAGARFGANGGGGDMKQTEIPRPSDAVLTRLAAIAVRVEELMAFDQPSNKAPVGLTTIKNDRRRSVEQVLDANRYCGEPRENSVGWPGNFGL